MRALIASLVFAAAVLAAGPSVAADSYGAIAHNPSTGARGWSYNYANRSAAEQRALAECGRGCRVAIWFRNACGALATASRGGWGSGWAPSRAGAEQVAMRECRNAGNRDCRIAVWSCTDR